jgi:hypothetical protein
MTNQIDKNSAIQFVTAATHGLVCLVEKRKISSADAIEFVDKTLRPTGFLSEYERVFIFRNATY